MWCINWEHYNKEVPPSNLISVFLSVNCQFLLFPFLFLSFFLFLMRVLFAGRDLDHLLFPSLVFFWILSNFKGKLKVFVASLCYWLWKGISSICCHRSMIAYHRHLFFLFSNYFFCATSWATVYKARIYYYLCNATTILYWFVLESQCFSMNKVWNTLEGLLSFYICVEPRWMTWDGIHWVRNSDGKLPRTFVPYLFTYKAFTLKKYIKYKQIIQTLLCF